MTRETVRTLSPDALQEHAGWMRGLVARLVHDSGRVDDLVQEAWTAALVNPPPKGLPLRAWLGGVVRRSVLATRRQDVRRRERETLRTLEAMHAGNDMARDVAEISACAEEQRALMEAVTELPEEQKSVLLLRFYEGLPPREIALALGVPVNTVRTRQRLGLDRLRKALDQRHNGDSSAWAALLLPLARMTPVRTSAVGVSTLLSVPAAVVRFLLLGLVLAGALIGVSQILRTEEGAPSLARLTPPDVALAEITRLAAESPTALERRSAPKHVTAAPTGPVFRGRVVDRDGTPIEGAELNPTSPPRKGRVLVMGELDAQPAWMTTNANGEFAAAAPGGNATAWVRVRHPDFAQVVEAVALDVDEPATITLVRIAQTTLEVEVVDAGSGRPSGAFSVICAQWQDPFGEGYARQSILSDSTDSVGQLARLQKRYVVDRPLIVRVMDAAGLFGTISPTELEQEIEPVMGGVTRVRFTLELDGPERSGAFPLAHGRVVDAATGEAIPHVTVTVLEKLVPAAAPNPREIHRRRVAADQEGAFQIAIPTGASETLGELSHPSYVPKEILLSADPTVDSVFALQRRGALRGVVLDRDGRPVAKAPMLLLLPGDEVSSARNQRRLTTSEDGSFALENLLPGRVQAFVLNEPSDADENAIASASFRMEPGSTRDVEIRVKRPELVHVTGEVVFDGHRMHGIVPAFLPCSDEGGWTLARATEHGFDAGGLERGTYLVALVAADDSGPADGATRRGDPALTLLPDVEITGFGTQRIEFTVPGLEISGRVVAATAIPNDLRAVAIPVGPSGFAGDLLESPETALALGHPVDPITGEFSLPRLARGQYRLEIRSASAIDQEPLATRTIELSGSVRIADWSIAR